MLKKFNNRTLIIIFLALLGLVAIVQLVSNQKGERNFREYLAKVDTTKIDKIEFIHFEKEPLVLEKSNKNQWQVKQGDKQAAADQSALKSLMKSLSNLKVKKRVAIKEEKWKEYEVNDSLGTKVVIHGDGEQLAELIVGRFSYKRVGQGFSMSTNARLPNEPEVYTVEGQLSMMTRRDFNGFRDHTLLSVQPANVQEVRFNYPADSSFVLTRQSGEWMARNAAADSTQVDKYLKKLENITAHNFAQEFNPGNQPVFKLNIATKNGNNHLVEAYPDDDKYVFRTSQNTGAIFREGKHIFEKMFVPGI